MNFKEQMLEVVEEGRCSCDHAYDFVREVYADAYDDWHTRAKEAGYQNPLVAPYFCETCHWSENAHPRDECDTGFIPGDPTDAILHNEKLRAQGLI